jgi:hypothetical protein
VGERAQCEIAIVGAAGRDREATVADHDGRHPERGRGRRERVPRELRVVVRVQVHDAGRQRQPARVHALARGAEVDTDADDTSVRDGDAARPRGAAQAVDHQRIVDHEVVHAVPAVSHA